MKRRDFLKYSALAGGAGLSGFTGVTGAAEGRQDEADVLAALPRQGPKEVVRGKKAVCSSSQPVVTDTMLKVMREGGNAVDAGVAGSLIQAVVEPHMTNHTGTVTFLYWEKKTGKSYFLNSSGTIVPEMPPFQPVPVSGFGPLVPPPYAAIPGFMPGLKAIHEKFGSKDWSYLCQPAIEAAEEGHVMHSFEYAVLESEMDFTTYFPSGRELFTPDGFTPAVGERWRNPKLAETLRRCAAEGPDYFITGGWAKRFVEEANKIGWGIELKHMSLIPPRWQEPLRYSHRGYEIMQLSPPEVCGLITAMYLGILRELGIEKIGHYSQSAESLYYCAMALNVIDRQLSNFNDPEIFGCPVDEWLAPDYIARLARIIRKSMPKIDLTKHIELVTGKPAMVAAGLATEDPQKGTHEPGSGSCELSIVDEQGNWVQMMNTLQTGGIPGLVVDGVNMYGSSYMPGTMGIFCTTWLTGGGRVTLVIGNTIVLRDGEPCLSLGTPGSPTIAVPEVLSNILDFGMDPYEASVLPRFYPMTEDYTVHIESRVSPELFKGMARLGAKTAPGPLNNWHLGSMQMSWRDLETGELCACADIRRAGKAGGL